jgi:hypothetical protein
LPRYLKEGLQVTEPYAAFGHGSRNLSVNETAQNIILPNQMPCAM